MISKVMHSALNDQINAELWSAYLYLSMSIAAESSSYKGAANWFFVQWLEEQDHARILQNYLADQNHPAVLKPIDAVPTKWDDVPEMFHDALKHEKDVTGMIDKLVAMAIHEEDYATLSRLQWFVDEQVEEEKNVLDMIELLDCPDNTRFDTRFIDDKLGEREYEKASALE